MLRTVFGRWPPYDLAGADPVAHLGWKLGRPTREPRQIVAVGDGHDSRDPFLDDPVDALWGEAHAGMDAVVDRTAETFNWRYFDPRARRYRVRGLFEGPALAGYLVLADSGPVGYIADLRGHPARSDVRRSLLDDGLALLRQSSVGAVRIWTNDADLLRPQFDEAGFRVVKAGPRMNIEVYKDRAARLTRVMQSGARVHMALGDSDLV
ncbi:MAG: hypothetical protein VYE73_12920 [Acidobacteriota bacterium]|nr:hypothetical protein [Acidobacteriota bacterium]